VDVNAMMGAKRCAVAARLHTTSSRWTRNNTILGALRFSTGMKECLLITRLHSNAAPSPVCIFSGYSQASSKCPAPINGLRRCARRVATRHEDSQVGAEPQRSTLSHRIYGQRRDQQSGTGFEHHYRHACWVQGARLTTVVTPLATCRLTGCAA
jgi:hypothetical protein